MNPGFDHLQDYPFERLARIRAAAHCNAALAPINMSIGEPQHPTPPFIQQALVEAIGGTGKYPTTKGADTLRQTIGDWLVQRFNLGTNAVDPNRHVLPVNGTREALFSVAQCVVDRDQTSPLVAMPNPFYQIYEGAAFLAGAEPHYIPCPEHRNFLPALDEVSPALWERCQLLYLCTPGNPSGRVMPIEQLRAAIELADKYDFIIVSDECYSELYIDESLPPPGLLEAAWTMGRSSFERCVVMHSLSKRSNAPGLRSGFVAGDATILQAYLRYRTYHGCAMPLHVQAASVAAWSDETHVIENRRLYREKFAAVVPILAPHMDIPAPEAGFYLWPNIHRDDVEFCRQLLEQQNVVTLPGQFLARLDATGNPGLERLRLVLTDTLTNCVEAANRIAASCD